MIKETDDTIINKEMDYIQGKGEKRYIKIKLIDRWECRISYCIAPPMSSAKIFFRGENVRFNLVFIF